MILRQLLLSLLLAVAARAQVASLDAGITHYNARRWTEAHAFFAAAVKSQPRSAESAYWYGKTLMAQNKSSDAEHWFAKATDLDPRSSEYELWLARAIGDQARRANVLKQPFLARRMKVAVDKSIAIDPNNLDARELRWQFYSQAPGVMGGGADKAQAEAAEISKRNRYRGQFLALSVSQRAKDDAATERTLKSMIAEYPDSLRPTNAYSAMLADRGRAAEAFAVVDGYLKRRPNDPLALYQVGRVVAVTGQQLDRGEAALRRYIALVPAPEPGVPTLSAAHFRLGNIAEKRGNTAAARAEYQTAVQLDSNNDVARKALAALK